MAPSPARLAWRLLPCLPLLLAAVPAVMPPVPDAEAVATPVPRPDRGAGHGTAGGSGSVGAPDDGKKAADQTDAGAAKDGKNGKDAKDARDGRCDVCGSDRFVCPVCVPRKTEKKVKKVCWGVKCDVVCVPGPSTWCGWKCERDDCGCWSYPVWRPNCAEVIERRLPEKREVTRVIPTWEWKMEERCTACACGLRRDPSCAAGD